MTAVSVPRVREVLRGPVRSDILLTFLLFCLGFAGSWSAHQRLAPEILNPITYDYWFESDVPDVESTMMDRWAPHWRARRHPLGPIALYAPTFVVHRIAGLPEALSIAIVTAGITGLFAAACFVLLRVSGLRRSDALIFTAFAGSSAAMVFWQGVPEFYIPGAISLVPILAVAGWAARGKTPSVIVCTVAAALTLGLSTNDWSVGLLALLVLLPFRKAVAAGAASFVLGWGVWRVEKLLMPGLPSFVEIPDVAQNYLFSPLGGGPVARLSSFLFHSMVMPEPRHVLGTYLSVQGVPPGPGTVLYQAGLLAWVALLGLGLWALVRGNVRRLSAVAGLAILSQLAFYQVFGLETFLYSAEVVPLFVAFVAAATFTRLRLPALILALVFTAAAGANNIGRFRDASRDLQEKFAREHAFTERVAELTDPARPLIYGARAAAAEGIVKPPPPPAGLPTSVWYLRLFPDLDAERAGWHLYFDHWSLERIESYRAAGAAYFVSSYRYGLERSPDLLAELDARYERLEKTPDWVIYALHPETQVPEGGP